GVDMTSWGADLPASPKLGDLVQRILKLVPDLPRLRISSIDSIEADEALIEAAAHNPRFMPHLHLSLQAGDNMILKRMKRRHSREDAIEFCAALKQARPEMVFGADIIAGFPTETDQMFENSLRLVEDCDLTWLHVFPFSPRAGTPAARMPQLDRSVIKDRARRLREKGDQAVQRHLLSKVGQNANILMENDIFGRTEGFTPVQFQAPKSKGQILTAKIIDANADHLIAA
ncbi:MAG: radical SAM protein, partial [Pseudomonadota bacterium]